MRTIASVLLLVPLSLFAGTTDVTLTTSDGRTTQIDVPGSDSVDVIVEFRDTPLLARPRVQSAAETATAMKQFDARFAQFTADVRPFAPQITHTYERVFAGASMTVSRAAIPQIERLSYVRRVHYDSTVHALADDDNIAKVNAPQVWQTYGTRGQGVVVAVLDTGVDYRHPALGGVFGSHGRVTAGWDFVNKDADPMDDNGHGTHVAGIIGANGGGLTGVAPDVTFLAYKVLDKNGSGKESDVIAGIERASSDHADVVNMSLGGPGTEDDPMPKAVETAIAAGTVFCIAAGNSGGFYTVSAPANAPSSIAVGATDIKDVMAVFSSGGPSGNSLALKPEVVAPGVNVVSALLGGGTIAHSGTSMATPHVAGVAALVKAMHPDWTPAEIKSAIVTTAEVINADVMSQGGGRVDALRATGIDLIASPTVISLGRDDSSQNRWTSTSQVNLTNRSNAGLTLTASSTTTPAGITVTVDPEALTLGPGETATATVKIDVDNTVLPYPLRGSLALSGRIVFTGGASPIHVPWAFVKAARIRAQYDREESATLMVLGTAGSRTFALKSFDRTRSADAFVAPGTYDVQVYSISGDSTGLLFRFILGERQTISSDTSVDFRGDMAGNVAVVSSSDDEGRALADIGRNPGICYDTSFVTYPPGSPIGWLALGFSSRTGTKLRLAASAPHDGISVTANEQCWDGASSVYVAQYGEITTSNGTPTISIDPSTWKRAPLKILAPDGLKNATIVFGPATLTRSVFGFLTEARLQTIPLEDKSWTGTLLINPEQHPLVTAGASLRLVADFDGLTAVRVIDARLLRATNEGILLWPYPTTGPATYVAKSGELLTFGAGPIHPEGAPVVDTGVLTIATTWVGPLDELRAADNATMSVTVRDLSGTIVGTTVPLKLPAPGVYEAEIKNGAGTLTARVDSRNADAAAPTLRSLRVFDENGRQTSVIHRNARAKLRFGAMDVLVDRETHIFSFAAVKPERTSASWRPHGSAVWQPLALTVEATEIANGSEELTKLGHPPAGVVFASDLLPASQNDGPVDLRLHIEDDSGNSIDYVLDDALLVAEGHRRATNR